MAAAGPVTPRTRVSRLPDRGRYDRATIDAILDEALVCHVGFAAEGQPYVIPTLHARVGDRLYVHGSAASRMLRNLAEGPPVCVTATLVDGLVLARSAFHHSVNYRSVVVLGRPTAVDDPEEKLQALRSIVEHVLAGRWEEVRPPNDTEMRATSVLSLPIDEASAKVRVGPPKDDEEDLALSCWAGVLPLALAAGLPVPDPHLRPGLPTARSLTRHRWPALEQGGEGG